MSRDDDDALMAELQALPGPRLDADAHARTLTRATAALALATARPPWWRRWLMADTLIPALLGLGGLLYVTGALRQIAEVYGPAPRALSAALAPKITEPRGLVAGSANETERLQPGRRAHLPTSRPRPPGLCGGRRAGP